MKSIYIIISISILIFHLAEFFYTHIAAIKVHILTQRVGKLHIVLHDKIRGALFCCFQLDSSPATTYSCSLVIGGAHPILSVRWRLSRLTCPLTLLLLLLHLKYVYRYHRYYLIGILLGFCYAVNVFLLWPSKKNQQRVLMCHPGISANNWRKKSKHLFS